MGERGPGEPWTLRETIAAVLESCFPASWSCPLHPDRPNYLVPSAHFPPFPTSLTVGFVSTLHVLFYFELVTQWIGLSFLASPLTSIDWACNALFYFSFSLIARCECVCKCGLGHLDLWSFSFIFTDLGQNCEILNWFLNFVTNSPLKVNSEPVIHLNIFHTCLIDNWLLK